MKYSVNIYGGGDVQSIINGLRELSNLLLHNIHKDLNGDGFETKALIMELSNYDDDADMEAQDYDVFGEDKI